MREREREIRERNEIEREREIEERNESKREMGRERERERWRERGREQISHSIYLFKLTLIDYAKK